MRLEIEKIDVGGFPAEAYYTEHPYPALMAIQPGLPNETQQAREIEAHGYYRHPPRGGRKFCLALSSMDLDKLDEAAIWAIRRVIDDLAPELVEQVKRSYRASEYGDAFWIAWDCDIHVYVVIAILRNLEERRELAGYE